MANWSAVEAFREIVRLQDEGHSNEEASQMVFDAMERRGYEKPLGEGGAWMPYKDSDEIPILESSE